LANNVGTLVSNVNLQDGTYSELRLVLSGGYIEVENENGTHSIYASSPDYPGLPPGAAVAGLLQMPSGASSGLKVDFPNSVEVSGDTKLLVDFDVSQSFGSAAGGSGNWVMHPVIKGARLSDAASIKVNLKLGSAVVLPNINGEPTTLASFR